MHINGIYSYASIFQNDAVSNKQNCASGSIEMEGNAKTADYDTVSLSHEALEKYLSMKNSSSGAEEKKEETQDASRNDFLRQAYNDEKKTKRMDSAELVAFLKSDTFAEEAVGYAKAVVAEGAAGKTGEDEASDQIIKDMDAQKRHTASTAQTGNDSDDACIDTPDKNGSAGPIVNGKRANAKELAAEIHKLEEEVKELTATYELIMGGEGELEEKFRLSRPVQKRLDERLHELQSLKTQSQMMQEEKTAKNA